LEDKFATSLNLNWNGNLNLEKKKIKWKSEKKKKEKEFRRRLGRGAKFGPINPATPAHTRINFPSSQSLARGAVGQSVLARSPG
jgi:hypothetical protein